MIYYPQNRNPYRKKRSHRRSNACARALSVAASIMAYTEVVDRAHPAASKPPSAHKPNVYTPHVRTSPSYHHLFDVLPFQPQA